MTYDPLTALYRDASMQEVMRRVQTVIVAGLLLIAAAAAIGATWHEALLALALGLAVLAAGERLRRGDVNVAARVIIATQLFVGIIGVASYGSIRSVTSVSFVGAAIVAGLFLGRRSLVATTSLASFAIAGLIVAERLGVLRPIDRPVGAMYWLVLTASIVLLGFTVQYARAVTIEALRRQEQELEERKQAEQRHAASEERLRLAMEATRQGWFDLKVPTGDVIASSQFLRMVGSADSQPTLTLDRWLANVHHDDRAAVMREFEACLTSDETRHMDYRLRMGTGEWRWIRSVAKVAERDAEGRPLRLTGTHADITEQRAAATALAEGEARYRALVDHTPIAICVHRDGRFIYANPASAALLGVETPAEIVGRSVLDIVHPDSLAVVLERLRATVERNQPAPLLQERLLRFDGSVIEALVQNIPIMFEGERAIQVSCLDITERSRAEQRLRDSEEQLRVLTDTVPGFLVQLDTEFRYIRVNRGFELMAGLPAAQLLGRTPSEIFGDAEWEHVRPYFERALKGETVEFESLVPFLQAPHRWVRRRATPAVDAEGRVTSIVLLGEDITATKEAEQARLRAAKEFKGMLAATTDGFLVVGTDERLLDANDAAARMLGYSRDELLTLSVRQLDVHAASSARAAQFASDTGRPRETIFRRKDGTQFEAEVSSTFVAASERLFCFVRDISDRKRMDELRLRSQKLESLGTLAGGIAHDFNNILSAIRGNVELAGEDIGPGHPAGESLEEILKASTRAAELVRRITAFGRPKEPSRAVVHLTGVVQEVLKLLRPTTPATIALRVNAAADLPPVFADAGQVHEAIVNLTTNAAHAIGNRVGAVDYELAAVDMSGEAADRLRLPPGRYARLAVRDDGCGMTADTVARVFDVFFTTKPLGEGTGLGLSMVYGIMQSHGGAVSIESTPGVGSTFHLYFPAADPDAAREAQRALASQAVAVTPRRVLFVDDESALVALAERALTRHRHRVSGFTHPMAALEAFRADPQAFDIVITDLSMPHMTGVELAEKVHAIRSDIPVVMMTGFLGLEDDTAARAAGVREVLGKASSVHELSRAIERAFSEPS